MIGRATLVWLFLALGIGIGLFQLKYRVQELEQNLAQTNRDILTNEEAIHVLKADWSYLNRPEKIDPLARRFLGLAPLTGAQYMTIADLPMRAAPLVSSTGAPAAPAKSIAPTNTPASSGVDVAPSAKRKTQASATRPITLAKETP